MRFGRCSCRRWDLTGTPCRHALRVLADYPHMYNLEDLIISWYRTSWWQNTYKTTINPLNGMKFWKESGETPLEAPPVEITRGPPKGPAKRKQGINESPTKGKSVSRHGKQIHCGLCGVAGHNRAGCDLNPDRRPKKKARKNAEPEAYDLDGEGPSQPTQPTQ